MVERRLGFTFGRTPEGDKRDYEELEKRLAQQATTPNIPDTTQNQQTTLTNPTPGWLYVPSIGMEFSPNLEGHNLNWYDAHKLARSKGFVMPSPYETWELFFEAKANLSKPEFRKIYEFFTKKTPEATWHGEWQDAFFEEEKGKMYMYRLKDFNAKREPEFHKKTDITGTYLTRDCYANISQKMHITSQGLCKVADSREKYVDGENIFAWYPVNGAVAGFGANSDRSDLYCDLDPSYTNPSLGVRFARRVAPSATKNSGGSS